MKKQLKKLRDQFEDSLITILVILLVLAAAIFFYNRLQTSSPTTANEVAPSPAAIPIEKPDYSGLTISNVFTQDVTKGHGQAAKSGSKILISYSIWVYDPKKPENRGTPIEGTPTPIGQEITIGQGDSVFGELERFLEGVSAGSKRNMIFPPASIKVLKLNKSIPSDIILLFEIETISVDGVK